MSLTPSPFVHGVSLVGNSVAGGGGGGGGGPLSYLYTSPFLAANGVNIDASFTSASTSPYAVSAGRMPSHNHKQAILTPVPIANGCTYEPALSPGLLAASVGSTASGSTTSSGSTISSGSSSGAYMGAHANANTAANGLWLNMMGILGANWAASGADAISASTSVPLSATAHRGRLQPRRMPSIEHLCAPGAARLFVGGGMGAAMR